MVFMIVAWLIGGSAWSGGEEDGRYYLSNHGQLTEVSYLTYEYSRWHTFFVMFSMPLAVVVSWILGAGSKSNVE